jgi:hypothetical protein
MPATNPSTRARRFDAPGPRHSIALAALLATGGCAMEMRTADDATPGRDVVSERVGDASAIDALADANAPDSATTDAGGGICTLPTCADVDVRLRSDFGIAIIPGTIAFHGLAAEDIGCADRIKVYQMFALPFAYTRYRQLIDPSSVFTFNLYRDPAASYYGYTPNARTIQIANLREQLAGVSGPADSDFTRIAEFLIHESGHILRDRNPALGTAFATALDGLVVSDRACYDGRFLISYAFRSGVNANSESMAESIGLFIANRNRGPLGTIRDFRNECPNTYEWTRANVFNNVP